MARVHAATAAHALLIVAVAAGCELSGAPSSGAASADAAPPATADSTTPADPEPAGVAVAGAEGAADGSKPVATSSPDVGPTPPQEILVGTFDPDEVKLFEPLPNGMSFEVVSVYHGGFESGGNKYGWSGPVQLRIRRVAGNDPGEVVEYRRTGEKRTVDRRPYLVFRRVE